MVGKSRIDKPPRFSPPDVDERSSNHRISMSCILYKYLDIVGATWMLGMKEDRKFPNLQLTNASQLNDPFDCHPKLIDYSNVPDAWLQETPKEWWIEKEENDALNLRNNTWLCSLSKVNNSLLMWSHYCYNHKGVCIGLDMYKVIESVPICPACG